jgi:hypothetical protein
MLAALVNVGRRAETGEGEAVASPPGRNEAVAPDVDAVRRSYQKPRPCQGIQGSPAELVRQVPEATRLRKGEFQIRHLGVFHLHQLDGFVNRHELHAASCADDPSRVL